ncbi:hypothetical protein [Legionella sp. km772]|uniref:hypothetical protein n=1 Tax=Legionella sp. km772 TaxID=2498111 RepID=UPI000F8D363A|nr:hypothetical protein [Legionella sp. km772]RUR04443.1 hypothetical protein ELY15_15490 [Legionella sp. km772]
MKKNDKTTAREEFLIEIVQSLSQLANREAAIYSDYTQQIRNLIIDAVGKINSEFLTNLEDDEQTEITITKGHASNLLHLLHKALDVSKILNNKINAVMHAIQIEDIAGQIMDEVFHRIHLNLLTINSIQEKINNLSNMSAEEKLDVLQYILAELNVALERKKRDHVNQTDLNEGTTELF